MAAVMLFFYNLKRIFWTERVSDRVKVCSTVVPLRKVTIWNVSLTQEKCRMATVKPISRKTFPKSVRLSFEVTTKRGKMSETIRYPLLEPVCKHWQLLSLQDELEKIMRCPSISVFLDYQFFFLPRYGFSLYLIKQILQDRYMHLIEILKELI